MHIMRIKELLEIIYNKSNEMLMKFRTHFSEQNTVLQERSLEFNPSESNRCDAAPGSPPPHAGLPSITSVHGDNELVAGKLT